MDEPVLIEPPAWLAEYRRTGKMPKDRKVPISAEEFWAELFAVLNQTAKEMKPEG